MTFDEVDRSLIAHYLPSIGRLTIVKDSNISNLPDFVRGLEPTSRHERGKKDVYNYKDIQLPSLPKCDFTVPTQVDQLCCRRCMKVISKVSLHVKELPGSYWMDLVDCWSCHQSEFAMITQRLSFTEDGHEILPRSGQMLYRGLYLVVSLEDLQVVGEDCSCGYQIGKFMQATGSDGPTHLKIPLDVVALGTSEPDYISILFDELRELFENTGSASFHLSTNTGEESFIKVLSWDSQLWLGINGYWSRTHIVQLDDGSVPNEESDHLGRVPINVPSSILGLLKSRLCKGSLIASSLGLDSSTAFIVYL